MALGAAVCVWRHRAELPGSSKSEVTRDGRATRSAVHSDDGSRNQVPLFLEDPVRALFKMYGTQEEHGDAGTQASTEDALATAPVEPSIFNVDVVAMGPHAYEIVADQDLLDQQEEVEQTNSAESMAQAPSSAVNGLSSDATHNEQILQGKVTVEDQSIGPKEVDPDSHPPTN